MNHCLGYYLSIGVSGYRLFVFKFTSTDVELFWWKAFIFGKMAAYSWQLQQMFLTANIALDSEVKVKYIWNLFGGS